MFVYRAYYCWKTLCSCLNPATIKDTNIALFKEVRDKTNMSSLYKRKILVNTDAELSLHVTVLCSSQYGCN